MSNPYQPYNSPPGSLPPGQQHDLPRTQEGDATGGMIPYKNMPALLAYYLGIVSLLCCVFGVPFGFIPLILGVIGLNRRAANPVIKGSAHAWIGIVLGGLNIAFSLLFLVLFIIAALADR